MSRTQQSQEPRTTGMPTRSDTDSARHISIGTVEPNDEPAGWYYRARALRMNVDMRMGLKMTIDSRLF